MLLCLPTTLGAITERRNCAVRGSSSNKGLPPARLTPEDKVPVRSKFGRGAADLGVGSIACTGRRWIAGALAPETLQPWAAVHAVGNAALRGGGDTPSRAWTAAPSGVRHARTV